MRSCSSTCRPTGGSFTPRSAVRPSAARRVDAVAGAERAVFALSRQYSGGCPVRSQSLYSLTLSQERCTVHHSCGRPILPNCLVQRKPLRETCALMQPRGGGKQRDQAQAKKKQQNARRTKGKKNQHAHSGQQQMLAPDVPEQGDVQQSARSTVFLSTRSKRKP